MEALADRGDALAIVIPEHEHDEVLRVRQLERRQQRAVCRRHRVRRRVPAEAQLIVDAKAHARRTSTTMLPRVAFEYGQTSWAALTSAVACSRGSSGRSTISSTARPKPLPAGPIVTFASTFTGPVWIFCRRAMCATALPKQAA